MIEAEEVRGIVNEVLEEEHLHNFTKIFEKEHNLFRGSHDKMPVPPIIVENYYTQTEIDLMTHWRKDEVNDVYYDDGYIGAGIYTKGSVLFVGDDGKIIEDNTKAYWHDASKQLNIGDYDIASSVFSDDFEDGSIHASWSLDQTEDDAWVDAGTKTITEAGGVLTIAIAEGTSGYWSEASYSGCNFAPKAYMRLKTTPPCEIITKITDFTINNDGDNFGGLIIGTHPNHCYGTFGFGKEEPSLATITYSAGTIGDVVGYVKEGGDWVTNDAYGYIWWSKSQRSWPNNTWLDQAGKEDFIKAEYRGTSERIYMFGIHDNGSNPNRIRVRSNNALYDADGSSTIPVWLKIKVAEDWGITFWFSTDGVSYTQYEDSGSPFEVNVGGGLYVGLFASNSDSGTGATSVSFKSFDTTYDETVNSVIAERFRLTDTNEAYLLAMKWNEADSVHRLLNLKVEGGDRTLDLYEDFTIGDGHAGTLIYSAASKVLTVEDTAVVSQDYSSDSATVQFAKLGLGTAASTQLLTVAGNILVTGADDQWIQVDSNTRVRFILDSHDADAVFHLQEDNVDKWTFGYDFSDSGAFVISEGVPGTNNRFKIAAGGVVTIPGTLTLSTVAAAGTDTDKFLVLDSSGNVDYRTGAQLADDIEGDIDHDALTNFEANEHINHTSVSVSAGTGLSGGGTIAATRTLALSHLGLESLADPSADKVLFWDNSESAFKWLTISTGLLITAANFTTKDSEIVHDSLSGFVADEHIAHSGVSIAAAGILSGGGTIAANREISLVHGDVDHDQLTNTHNLTDDIDHDALTNTHNLSTDIDHGGLSGLTDIDHNWAATKTTAAWSKTIGAASDYADWATMIAAMPDTIAHAVTVEIETGTILTEICHLENKNAVTRNGTIIIKSAKYYPTSSAIPTAESGGPATLTDTGAFTGNDYSDCWVLICKDADYDDDITAVTQGGAGAGDFGVAGDMEGRYLGGESIVVTDSTGNNGTYTISAGGSAHAGGVTTIPVDEAVPNAVADGLITATKATTNGFCQIDSNTDDILTLKANWPHGEVEVGDRYNIVGALIDAESVRTTCMDIRANTPTIRIYGIGFKGSASEGLIMYSNTSRFWIYYCGFYNNRYGITLGENFYGLIYRCGIVGGTYNGIYAASNNIVRTRECGVSDNASIGLLGTNGGFLSVHNNFGDGNGTWGSYAQYSAQVLVIGGAECYGSSGAHSDEGTAGSNADDQASVYA